MNALADYCFTPPQFSYGTIVCDAGNGKLTFRPAIDDETRVGKATDARTSISSSISHNQRSW